MISIKHNLVCIYILKSICIIASNKWLLKRNEKRDIIYMHK